MDTPFRLIEAYSSLRVLFFGMITALSFTGTGLWPLNSFFGKKIPFVFALPTATLLGIHIFSFLIQISGFAHCAVPCLLKAFWFLQVVFGYSYLFYTLLKWTHNKHTPCFKEASLKRMMVLPKSSTVTAITLGVLLIITLLVSLAPSTKIDELYYHMLVPLRLLQEGGINYYRIPFEGMMPHMHFQITAAPLFALGVTDALNVTSWYLSAILVWFCGVMVFQNSKNLDWALIASLGMYGGMYAPVWFVTGGAGSVSVLGMTFLVFVTLKREEIVKQAGEIPFLGIVSILSMALAASKLSYLPFAALCLTICAFAIWRDVGYKNTLKICLVAWSAWVVFYLPALLWTWAVSGYPLGAMADPSLAEIISSTQKLYHSPRGFLTQMAIHFLDHTPLVWGGCILFMLSPKIRKDKSVWLTGISLLLFQATIIALKLPLTPRFFGGLPHGVALYFWIDAERNAPNLLRGLFSSKRIMTVLYVLITPWFFLHLFYSAQFLPVVMGKEPVKNFAERLIPFYYDFQELDKLLPDDAVLLVQGIRVDSVYSPRPVVFDKQDLGPGVKNDDTYLFCLSSSAMKKEWDGNTTNIVYQNNMARVKTFRTPGRKSTFAHLIVYQLIP